MALARRSMHAQIAETLRERILDETYPPGFRLVELRLAEEFGTSQAPVREALRELEAQRLVEVIPYKGTRVREVGVDEMLQAYQARAAIEEAAARIGAARPDATWDAVEAAQAAVRAAAAAGDAGAYAAADRDFHRAIVAASENMHLLGFWDALGSETRARVLLGKLDFSLEALASEHEPVVAALLAGDGEAAGRGLREHAEGIRQVVAAGLRDL